jgi:hypothetical protein
VFAEIPEPRPVSLLATAVIIFTLAFRRRLERQKPFRK